MEFRLRFWRLAQYSGIGPVIGLLLTVADDSTIMLHLYYLWNDPWAQTFPDVVNVAQSGYNFYIKECFFFSPFFS